MGENDTLLNAVIGAVVTVVLSFTFVSPVVGGAVAGYLQRADGVRVGALSGAIATVPFLLLFFVFGGFLLSMPMMGGGGVGVGVPGGFLVLALFGFAFALAWNVGLAALGGYLGVYVATESQVGR